MVVELSEQSAKPSTTRMRPNSGLLDRECRNMRVRVVSSALGFDEERTEPGETVNFGHLHRAQLPLGVVSCRGADERGAEHSHLSDAPLAYSKEAASESSMANCSVHPAY